MISKLCVLSGRGTGCLRAIFSLLLVFACGFVCLAPGLSAQTANYAGVLTTVNSGNGAPAGLAVDTNGNVYISYPSLNSGSVIQVPWTAASGYGAPIFVASNLGSPFGLAVDRSGNLFIAVSGPGPGVNTGTVMEASPSGVGSWTLTTAVSGLNSPKGVAVDGGGNLYIADSGSQTVIEIPIATGTPVTLASTATSSNGGDFTPYGVAVDGSGDVFVADRGDQFNLGTVDGTVTEIPPGCTTAICQILLDNGMHYPEGIVVDASGNLFIADYQFGWILELPWTGSVYSSTHPPLFNSGILAVDSRYYPTGVAVDQSGNVYFSDTRNSRVEKGNIGAVDFGTESVGSPSATISVSFVFIENATVGGWAVLTHGVTGLDFADAQSGTCSSNGPSASYIVNDGCTVDVTFTPQNEGLRSGAVVLKDTNGNVIATAYLHGIGAAPQMAFSPGTQSPIVSSGLSSPTGVTVDEGGNIYVVNSGGGSVVKSSGGSQSTVVSGLSSPLGVAVDGGGNVYIADSSNSRVVEIPWTGSSYGPQTTVVGGLSNSLKGVAVDGGGNLYIADSGNKVVVKIPWIVSGYGPPLTLASTATNGTSFDPVDVAVDVSGNVYIADIGDSLVAKVPWTSTGYGVQSTVGSGLSSPVGVAVDESGNVYITDSVNHDVVKVPWTGSSYGTQSTIADLTTNGNSFIPAGVAMDGSGNIYIVDAGTSQVVEVDVADPPTLTFAATPAGATSSDSPKTVVVTSIGNVPLVLASNPLYPANFSENSTDTNLCVNGDSLAVGASCDVSADFMPPTAGSFSGQIVLTDNAINGSGTQSIGVSGTGTLALSPASLPAGTVGTAYSQTIAATGGSGPYTFSPTGGALPAGLGLSASGLLSGTPTAGGSFSITITATDSNNQPLTGLQAYSLSIGAPTITLSPASLPDTTYGINYSQTLTASGGTPSYSFSVTSGSLPAGLFLNSGVLSGTPVAGSYNFTVLATDSSTGTGPYSSSQAYFLTVNQTTPTLSLTCTEVTYNGNAHSCVGTATGVGGVALAGTWSYTPANASAAGSTPITGTFTSSDANYTSGGTASGTLKIDAATPTLSLTCTEVTYDGNAHSCVGTATGIGGAVVSGTWSFTPPSATTAGSTPVTGTFTSSDANYTSGGTASGTLKIDVATPTLSLNCTEVPYDGNAHSCVGTATGIGGAVVSGTWNYSPTSATTAGSTPVIGTFTSSNANYASGTASGTLKIDPASPTLSLTCTEVTYDGNAHSCVGTATGIGGAAISGTWGYSPTSATVAGSTSVTGTFTSSNTNYTSGTASGTLKIDAATPTLSLMCTEVTYDGNPHSCVGTATGIGGVAVAGTWSYTPPSATTAGSTPVNGTFTSSNANYASGGSANGTLKIDAATPTLSLTCTEITYDGNSHSCVGTATGIGGAAVSGTWSYTPTSATVAGSTPVTGTFTSSNANYASGTAIGTLKIDPATPTLSLTCTETTYDANAHSCVGTATGIGGAVVSGTWSYSPTSATVAGSTLVTGTFTSSNANYTSGTTNGTLKIDAATPTLSLTCTEITYDGSSHSCVGSATGIGGVTVPGTWSYAPASVTPVGSTPVTGTFTSSNANYASGGTASGTLKIDAATPTLSLTCTETTYDGNGHSCVGAATGIGGAVVSGTWSYAPASVTAVGSTPVTGTFTSSNANYASGGTANGTLKIDAATPTLSLVCTEVTYDGNAHSCVGTATGIGGVAVSGTWSYAPSSATAAGSTPLTGTFTSSNANYASGTASGTLKIDAATPTLSLTCTEVTYDGNAHSCVGSATGIGGVAVAGTWSYTPASVTVVGSTPVTGTFTSSNANYESGGTATGTLKIDAATPASPIIGSMSPAFTSAAGAAFTLTVNGSGFTSNSTIYWGTSALVTQYVSAAQLTAQVTATNIFTAGTSAITVQTPAPGGGASNLLQFEVDSAGSGATAPTLTSITATVTAGSTASYPVTFPSSVTNASVTCLNLPSGATCSYSSSTNSVTIATSSTTPAGNYQVTLVFTETVTGAATAGILLPILLLPLVILRRRLAARATWMNVCAGLVLMSVLAFGIGCGGKSNSIQPPVNSTHQVESSGAVTLTVH